MAIACRVCSSYGCSACTSCSVDVVSSWRPSRISASARNACQQIVSNHHTTTPQPFYDPFSGTTRVRRCQKRTSGDFMVQRKINRGKNTHHPAGATPSGLTSAYLHHPSIILQAGCPSCHPSNSVKALKATSSMWTVQVTPSRRTLASSP